MFKRGKKKAAEKAAAAKEPDVEGGVSEEWNIDFNDLEFDVPIGKGNFGKVFKGSYYGTPVAIKRIKEGPSTGLDDEMLQKYVSRELSMLKGIRHPNFVQFMGYCVHETGQYLITEFVEGGDLREYILGHPEITWKQRVSIARDTAFAFTFLHKKGLIHRDLKPENLLITENGKIKVCDLGFARTNDKDRYMTIAGSDDYMAPEVLLGALYDEKCDVFGFGIVLGVLITGRKLPARHRKNGYAFKSGKLEALIPKDCPPKFASIILACCEADPEKRPEFSTILEDLKILLQELDEEEKKKAKETPRGEAPTVIQSSIPGEPPKSAKAAQIAANIKEQLKAVEEQIKTEKEKEPEKPLDPSPPKPAEEDRPIKRSAEEEKPKPVAPAPTSIPPQPQATTAPPPTPKGEATNSTPFAEVAEAPKEEATPSPHTPSEPLTPATLEPTITPAPASDEGRKNLSVSSPAVILSDKQEQEPQPQPQQPLAQSQTSLATPSASAAKPAVRRTPRGAVLDEKAAQEIVGGFDGSVSVKTRNILMKEAARLKKHGGA